MKNRHSSLKNSFAFNANGNVMNVKFGDIDQIYILQGMAATVLQIIEQAERDGFKDANIVIDDGDRYNWRSQNAYIDWYVERYTNYKNQNGCLERILYAYGHFIYDLVDQVAKVGKPGDLAIIDREAHYVGLPCFGIVNKRGIEIFTDALDALQRYEELYKKYAPNSSKHYYVWTDNNEEFLKLFGIESK